MSVTVAATTTPPRAVAFTASSDHATGVTRYVLEIFAEYLNLNESDELYRAAFYVLSLNLVQGDALTMRTHDEQPLTFADWGYLGKGKFQRRDFRLDVLTGSSKFSAPITARV